jgi:hypothetical protein
MQTRFPATLRWAAHGAALCLFLVAAARTARATATRRVCPTVEQAPVYWNNEADDPASHWSSGTHFAMLQLDTAGRFVLAERAGQRVWIAIENVCLPTARRAVCGTGPVTLRWFADSRGNAAGQVYDADLFTLEELSEDGRWARGRFELGDGERTAWIPIDNVCYEPTGEDRLDAITIGEVRHGGASWRAEWSRSVARAIQDQAPELIDDRFAPVGEITGLCPGYRNATPRQKRSFWALFMAALAYPESSYNPRTRYFEPAPLFKYSEGLFQLSVDDGAHGPACDFENHPELDILDPHDNIRCAVRVMRNQVASRRRLFLRHGYYYWSVLTNTSGISTIRGIIEGNLDQLPFC